MRPPVFAAPPVLSHQLVPGNTYALKLVADGKYVSVDSYKTNLFASSVTIGAAEQFQIEDAARV